MTWVPVPPPVYIENELDARQWLSKARVGPWALDTETDGLTTYGPNTSKMRCFSLSDGKQRVYLPADMLFVLDELVHKGCGFVYHNMNYDIPILRKAGIELEEVKSEDTMVFKFTHDPNEPIKLDELSTRWLSIPKVSYRNKFKNKSIWEIDDDELADYASLDAYVTALLYQELRFRASRETEDLYKNLMRPMANLLRQMSRRGVSVDRALAQKVHDNLTPVINILFIKLWSLAEGTINPRSPKQLQMLFFDKLHRKSVKKTKGGKLKPPSPSVDAEVLKGWAAGGCEISQTILEIRKYEKVISTYTRPILTLPEGYDFMHTSFNQTVARTGRLSSSDPNLQNLPKKHGVRNMYRARPGYKFIGADFSQLEIRILAHFSKDPSLIQAIKDGLDVHSASASRIADVPYSKVQSAKEKDDASLPMTEEEKELIATRGGAKNVIFGTIYGAGASKIARMLGWEEEKAEKFQSTYFNAYPNILPWREENLAFARKEGVAQTLLGRRRPVRELSSSNRETQGYGRRIAGNTPIQGSAADVVMLTMLAIQDKIPEAHQILQVHDEIVVEVKEEWADEIQKDMLEIMRNPPGIELLVPLEVTSKTGYNYGEVK